MHRLDRIAAIALAGQIGATGAQAQADDRRPPQTTRFVPKPGAEPTVSAAGDHGAQRRGVGNLPHTAGERFATLDAYLAYLQAGAAIDRPWYKEVRPGFYELQTTRTPPPERRHFTRAQLEKVFGFAAKARP